MTAPVLHWPKLFEGRVLGVANYTSHGYGSAIGYGHVLTGNGLSSGFGWHTGGGGGGDLSDQLGGGVGCGFGYGNNKGEDW